MSITPITYFCILFSIFAHYSFGKRLNVRGLITASLFGMFIPAMVVGLLAILWAGLIPWACYASICIAGTLTFHDLIIYFKKGRSEIKNHLPLYGFLALAGLVIYGLTEPTIALLHQEQTGQIFFDHNTHYSNYSSVVSDMLNADYLGRLRVSSFYPRPYVKYHFFWAAIQSISESLVPFPGLLTYFAARVVLGILFFLSFGEQMFLRFKFSFLNSSLFAAWMFLGFSLFGTSINWHLTTSNMFSLLAGLHFLLAYFFGEYRRAFLFSLLLGACAMCMIPISLALSLWVFWFHIRMPNVTKLSQVLKSIDRSLLSIAALLSVYIFLTVVTGIPSKFLGIAGKPIFSEDRLANLVVYRFLGYWYRVLINGWEGARFYRFDWFGYFDRVPLYSFLSYLFLGSQTLFLLVLTWIDRGSLLSILKKHYRIYIALFGILLGLPIVFFKDHAFLNLITALYLTANLWLITKISGPLGWTERTSRITTWFVVVVTGLVLLQQYFNIYIELKSFVMYVFYDSLLWLLIGLAMFVGGRRRKFAVGAVVLFCAFFLDFQGHRLFLLHFHGLGATAFVDVTPLIKPSAKREDFLNENGQLKIDSTQIEVYDEHKNTPSVIQRKSALEVYFSMLGSRELYTPNNLILENCRYAEGCKFDFPVSLAKLAKDR